MNGSSSSAYYEQECEDAIEIVGVEELIQKIIALKDDNFEHLSQTIPSLRRISNTTKKGNNVQHQDDEKHLTEFHKSFPVTSAGLPGLNIQVLQPYG